MQDVSYKSHIDEIYNIIVEDLKANDSQDLKNSIKVYINSCFEVSKKKIKIIIGSELENTESKRLYKLVCGNTKHREELRIIMLYLLNKIPGKPISCGKCNEKVTKEHLIVCNKETWNHFIRNFTRNQKGWSKINQNEMRKSMKTLPLRSIKEIIETKNYIQKQDMIKHLGQTILKSFGDCIERH